MGSLLCLKKEFNNLLILIFFINYSIFSNIYIGSSERISVFFSNLKKKTSVLNLLLTNMTNW